MSYRDSKILDYYNKKIYYINFEKKNNIVVKVNIEVKEMEGMKDVIVYESPNHYQREYMRNKMKKNPEFKKERKYLYNSRTVFCNYCKKDIKFYNRENHNKTMKHLKIVEDYNDITKL